MLVVINGRGGSGKDTFVDMVREIMNEAGHECYNISSVDKVKEAAIVLGWDQEKDNRGRLFLSNLKKMSIEYDGVMKYLKTEISGMDLDDNVCFVHIREPDEIDRFKQEFPEAKTMIVIRHQFEAGNDSDDGVDNYKYDITIPNEYGLNLLRFEATKFCVKMLKGVELEGMMELPSRETCNCRCHSNSSVNHISACCKDKQI